MSRGDAASGRVTLAALAHRHELDASATTRLEHLWELLARDPRAPSALHSPQRVLEDHLADSLAGLTVPELSAPGRVADLGAGAGLPGLALAAANPELAVVAVESNARKSAFIERAAAAAALGNVEVVCRRAEEWEEGRESCDAITARALASLAVVAEYAAPLLRLGGVLVAWRGRRDAAEEEAGALAASVLGLTVEEPRRVVPYPEARDRHLHVLRKTDATPSGFPRRPGIAVKRPLGGHGGSAPGGAGGPMRGAGSDRPAR